MTQPYNPTPEQIQRLRDAYAENVGAAAPPGRVEPWDYVEKGPEPYGTPEQIARLRAAYGGAARPGEYERTTPVAKVAAVPAVKAEADAEVARAAETRTEREIGDFEGDLRPPRDPGRIDTSLARGEGPPPTPPATQQTVAGNRRLAVLDRLSEDAPGPRRTSIPTTAAERATRDALQESNANADENSARWDALRENLRGLEADEYAQKRHSEENDRAWGEKAMRLRRAAGLPTNGYLGLQTEGATKAAAERDAAAAAPAPVEAAAPPLEGAAAAAAPLRPVPAGVDTSKLNAAERDLLISRGFDAGRVIDLDAPDTSKLNAAERDLMEHRKAAEAKTPPPAESKRVPRGAAAGGGNAPSPTADYDRAAAMEDELRRQALEAEAKKRPGYSPPVPQHEQPVSVQRQRALGPDAKLVAEEEAIQSAPGSMVDTTPAAPPPRSYDPKEILRVLQPPADANTPKKREAWAAEIAKDLAAKDMSLSTAASVMERRRPVYPAGLVRDMDRDDPKERANLAAELEDFNAAHVADIDAVAADADRRNAKARGAFDAREGTRIAAARGAAEGLEEKYGGPQGQTGLAKEELRLAARGHEDTAAAEREMAAIARKSAEDQGDMLRKKMDAEKPSVGKSILQGLALIVGGAGTGWVEGPSKAMDFVRSKTEEQAKSMGETFALQKGIELSRYRAIEHDLNAKLAMGLSEKQQIAVRALVGKVRLEQIRVEKELSAATRGQEAVASKVIPARAGGYGGGPSLDKMIALQKQRRELAKEGVELGAKAGERPKKAEKAELLPLDGSVYEQTYATSPGEGHQNREESKALRRMELSFAALEDQAKAYGTRAWNPARFENLVQEFAYDASNAKKQGVVKEPEMKAKLAALGSWTGGMDVIGDWKTIIRNSRQALLENAGAKLVK